MITFQENKKDMQSWVQNSIYCERALYFFIVLYLRINKILIRKLLF